MRSGCEVMYISASFDCAEKDRVKVGSQKARRVIKAPIAAMVTAGVGHEDRYELKNAPASVKAQYQSVDNMLNELENRVVADQVLSCQLNSLSRYFMRQSTLDRMAAEAMRPVLWVRK